MNPAEAAAHVYIALRTQAVYKAAFADSVEPYRAVVDLSRAQGIHSIVDGSEEYAALVNCLEFLLCA